ncbi:FHA domain-containing protein [Lignipirellula cremea]|uniref:Oxoglutarate dehydrogenase inhibitor n=1 Tax=Lignipirellula cremea TaxID=2528010 RepID=A0A518DSJ6_9BACT|nr:FHA domain-containing protein [Lignipirellula cremea]QDU94768.1 Oxoglutarate dehydrogenase inhibitor [Lignipirellula cremea]
MKAKLIVVGGDAKSAEINLKLPTVVGRGREASLTLPHPLVSRQHCEISENEGRLVVRDMGSLNGTFVNNQKIEEATFLPAGDLLTIGTVTFRAAYADPAQDSEVDANGIEGTIGPAEKTSGPSLATGDADGQKQIDAAIDQTVAEAYSDDTIDAKDFEEDGMEMTDEDWAEEFIIEEDDD